jgi:hypothetical protein
MSTNAVTAKNHAAEPTLEQQGWTEISFEEITDLGLDPWDPSMGDTDEGGEALLLEQAS